MILGIMALSSAFRAMATFLGERNAKYCLCCGYLWQFYAAIRRFCAESRRCVGMRRFHGFSQKTGFDQPYAQLFRVLAVFRAKRCRFLAGWAESGILEFL